MAMIIRPEHNGEFTALLFALMALDVPEYEANRIAFMALATETEAFRETRWNIGYACELWHWQWVHPDTLFRSTNQRDTIGMRQSHYTICRHGGGLPPGIKRVVWHKEQGAVEHPFYHPEPTDWPGVTLMGECR